MFDVIRIRAAVSTLNSTPATSPDWVAAWNALVAVAGSDTAALAALGY